MKTATLKIIAKPWNAEAVWERERIWKSDLPKEEKRELDKILMERHAKEMVKEITEEVLMLKEGDSLILKGKFLGASFVKKGGYTGKIIKISDEAAYIEWDDEEVNKIVAERITEKQTNSFDAGTTWEITLDSIKEE